MAGQSQALRIDDKGMRDMLTQLKKRTGMTFRDVVRGVTRDTLTAAARQTKQSKADMPKKRVSRILSNRYRAKSGAKVTLTKSGLVWYQGAGWGPKNWILLNRDGKLVGKKQANRTGKQQKQITLSPSLLSEVKRDIKEASAWRRDETKYLRGQIGSGKAAWLEIMRRLRMQPSSTKGLGRASKVKMSAQHRAALSGREMTGAGGQSFQIEVINRSQASLNPHAKGIPAFARALNGQVKRFQEIGRAHV